MDGCFGVAKYNMVWYILGTRLQIFNPIDGGNWIVKVKILHVQGPLFGVDGHLWYDHVMQMGQEYTADDIVFNWGSSIFFYRVCFLCILTIKQEIRSVGCC